MGERTPLIVLGLAMAALSVSALFLRGQAPDRPDEGLGPARQADGQAASEHGILEPDHARRSSGRNEVGGVHLSIATSEGPEPDIEAEPAAITPGEVWDRFDPEASKQAYPLPIYDWVGDIPRRPAFVYEDKYADLDETQLAQAKAGLKVAFRSALRGEFDRLRYEGSYSTFPIQYVDDGQGGMRKLPLSFRQSGATPLSKVTQAEDPNGDPVYEFTWLPPEDFEDLYLTMDELAWLTSALGSFSD